MLSIAIMISVGEVVAEEGEAEWNYETQIDTLRQRIQKLEESVRSDHGEKPGSQQSALKWAMSGLVATGGSTADDDELKRLQAGTHDPRRNGFTLQVLSLAVHAKLNHHLRTIASLVSTIEPDGESVVELEQAYIQASDLPYNLSAMAGQHFVDFAEENKRHPDDWDFVDVPIVITRLFGADKLRSQGIQLAWQPQLSWRSTLLLDISNPGGETVTSFLYQEGKEVAGHVLQARGVKGLDDMLYLLKWSQQLSIDNPHRVNYGVSVLFGPNATGYTTDTKIYALDFQWTRYANALSQQPRFYWRTEMMYRRYEAGDNNDPTQEILKDYGFFSQMIWHMDSQWVAGLRVEYADANKDNITDPLRDRRKRFSVNVSHPISKFINFRLQYNHDWAERLPGNNANSIWLQLVFKAGAHDEHV